MDKTVNKADFTAHNPGLYAQTAGTLYERVNPGWMGKMKGDKVKNNPYSPFPLPLTWTTAYTGWKSLPSPRKVKPFLKPRAL